jgi:hypothetical protein
MFLHLDRIKNENIFLIEMKNNDNKPVMSILKPINTLNQTTTPTAVVSKSSKNQMPPICQICQSLLRIDTSIASHLDETTYHQLTGHFNSRSLGLDMESIDSQILTAAGNIDKEMSLTLKGGRLGIVSMNDYDDDETDDEQTNIQRHRRRQTKNDGTNTDTDDTDDDVINSIENHLLFRADSCISAKSTDFAPPNSFYICPSNSNTTSSKYKKIK